MKNYTQLTKQELEAMLAEVEQSYLKFKEKKLSLNMARGKPGRKQLNLSTEILDVIHSDDDLTAIDGTDCCNYGVFEGIPEARALMGEMMGVSAEQVLVFGNSSLNIMYDTVSRLYTHGTDGNTPWCKLDKIKFLCPVPGYDRHFLVTEHFGIELINVPMTENGPDMDIVEQLVSSDNSIKGIWCVPKYSNPQGYSYSDETCRRMAALKPAAPDFRIFWDNAYVVHHLYEEKEKRTKILEIIEECAKAGNPNMVYEFCSTSKISLPGNGIAAIASSLANIEEIKRSLTVQTIGHDKINQLRHVRYFKNLDGIKAHMSRHAEILRPKFETVLEIFNRELEGSGMGQWTKPLGGYFISFDTIPGCAKEVVAKCKEAGMTLTGAGATYPYKKDPEDKNIRIAPSYPLLSEIQTAAELFTVCVKLVSIQKRLSEIENN